MKNDKKLFDIHYKVKKIDFSTGRTDKINSNTVLKGRLSNENKTGGVDFIKTFYEIEPIYCIDRVN